MHCADEAFITELESIGSYTAREFGVEQTGVESRKFECSRSSVTSSCVVPPVSFLAYTYNHTQHESCAQMSTFTDSNSLLFVFLLQTSFVHVPCADERKAGLRQFILSILNRFATPATQSTAAPDEEEPEEPEVETSFAEQLNFASSNELRQMLSASQDVSLAALGMVSSEIEAGLDCKFV